MQHQAPRGTADILPEEQSYWDYVRSRAVSLAKLYGYEQIDTPTFEDSRLFIRSVGEETDIVSKEMYTFQDRGGSDLTLRPEGTAPVCRAFIEHGMGNRPKPVKLFYFASIFRYDRPQAGRYREHHQFGFEAIGESSATLDTEVIDMAARLYGNLGLKTRPVQLNSIGCGVCRPRYLDELKRYYANRTQELCADCQKRYQKNPLRLLDCKTPVCQAPAVSAPALVDFLCPDCAAHFAKLRAALKNLDIAFEINNRLVRGLDYYTRTVFEIQPEEEGAQSTIGGGGRYDRLIAQLGGEDTPSIGFATGIERIILNLKRQNIIVPTLPKPSVFIAHLGLAANTAAIALAAELRLQNFGVIQSFGEKSLKSQLRQATSFGCRYTVILGEEEMKNGTAMLKDFSSGEQQEIALSDLVNRLLAELT